jgi:hypothetical protein
MQPTQGDIEKSGIVDGQILAVGHGEGSNPAVWNFTRRHLEAFQGICRDGMQAVGCRGIAPNQFKSVESGLFASSPA